MGANASHANKSSDWPGMWADSGFNRSGAIPLMATWHMLLPLSYTCEFQSLRRDTPHGNDAEELDQPVAAIRFQSLRRDTPHGNYGEKLGMVLSPLGRFSRSGATPLVTNDDSTTANTDNAHTCERR